MELLNLIIATASLVIAIVGSIYIPLYIHRDSHPKNETRPEDTQTNDSPESTD